MHCIFKIQNRIFKIEVIIRFRVLSFMDKGTEAQGEVKYFAPNHRRLVTGPGLEFQPLLILAQCSFHYIYF